MGRLGTFAALALCTAFVATSASAETIAMIGTGNVARALGLRFAEHGHEIVYGSRRPADRAVADLVASTAASASATTPREAAQRASIVVLAVPWNSVEEVVTSLGDLRGKILIDPTNPSSTAADGMRDYALADSNAERIQALAPGSRVVKAFNTLAFETMLDPASAGGPVTIPIVGDDSAAKETVVGLALAIGLDGLDVGPLRHARIVEGLHYLRFNSRTGPVNFYFPRDPNERFAQ